ncbi:uncharacterized protein LOC143179990 [Calliopsis andreniformis]|uniref:uncharacterized protein LOC143179990 n=1 Tax=Calliopsis andreniformis TaxID=337506 RepID=UPI003FCEC57F
MYLPQTVILLLTVSVYQALSQANTHEYSDQRPWSFVYAVQPFYNSETLLEVWRTDKAIDISANTVTTASSGPDNTVLYSEDVQHNNTNLQAQNNVSYFVSEAKNTNEEQLSKNRQRLSNYRNRRKDANFENK